MIRSHTKALPATAAYDFARKHGLESEIKKIEGLKPVRWKRSPNVTTGVLRGYIVDLFEKHGRFEEFKKLHWPNGNTPDGKRRINDYRRWKREYEALGGRKPG